VNRLSSRISDLVVRNQWSIPRAPFYQHYPFGSRVSIRSADSRGCIDLDLGFFCNRIPKAANSTVTASLASLKLQRKVGSKEAKRLFATPSELSGQQFERFQGLYKFLFVRNPFSRTLSAYLDKVQRKAIDKGAFDLSRMDRQAIRKGFSDFLVSLEEGQLHSNAHWAPQTSILLIPLEEFDFLGRVETLDEDLAYVLQSLSNPVAGAKSNDKINEVRSNATGAGSKLSYYYDDESINRVQSLYQADFEQLKYSQEFEWQ